MRPVETDAQPMLSVKDLVVEFERPGGIALRAVDNVSFDVYPNETLAIVGESGSGKSMTMLAVMGLLPAGARVVSGSITLRGADMLAMSAAERRHVLGRDISMIFQDPMTSMNPVMKVGRQIAEMITLHDKTMNRAAVRARVVELLELVRIPSAARRADAYPHELSGGQRQRVMIAMAVAHGPSMLIADEPTTALDVTIQAQVLRVLADIRRSVGTSMALITHDLGLVAEYADRVVVLYGGRVMEIGTVHQIFAQPQHPYTVGLLASSIRLDSDADTVYAIPGQPPTIESRPPGCVFNPRCDLKRGRSVCDTIVPVLSPSRSENNLVACHFSDEIESMTETIEAMVHHDIESDER